MGIGVLLFLAMTVAFLVFTSFGLLFYKLLPPAEPLLPIHIHQKTNSHELPAASTPLRRAPPQRYRSNFLIANP